MKFRLLFITIFGIQLLFAQNNNENINLPSVETTLTEGILLDAGYKPTYYRLEMNVDPYHENFSGKTTIHFQTLETLNQIEINAKPNLQIQTISYHNQSITNFTREGNVLKINLPQNISTNQTDSIAISFSGNASSSTGILLEQHAGIPVWATLSEPFHASSWWVCKDDLLDKPTKVDIIVTHPASMKAGSNGKLISVQNVGSNSKKTHWQHNYAIPTYLIAIAVSNYVEYNNSVTINGTEIPIINYMYPESVSQWSSALDEVPSYITYLSEIWGEYPYKSEKYGHAMWNRNGGMEHSTMSFMGKFTFGLVTHELAHQWFGNKVTCATWSDIWINEGFSEYGEGLLLEYLMGNESFKSWKESNVTLITSDNTGSVYNPEPENQNRIFNNRLTYAKGSMIVHLMRYFIDNDDMYFQALRNILDEFAWDFATTENIKTSLENSTGLNWNKFFADWIYGEGHPNISVHVNKSANAYRVEIQQTPSHSSVSYFETPFEIEFVSAQGQKITKRFFLNANQNTFWVNDLPFEVESFTPNPQFDVVCKIVQTSLNNKELDESKSQISIYPNPTNEFFIVSAETKIDEIKIWDLSGKLIQQFQPNAKAYTIPIQNWTNGTYLIQVQSNKNFQTQKLIVK